jgi:hypothetical protein
MKIKAIERSSSISTEPHGTEPEFDQMGIKHVVGQNWA